MLIPLWFVIVFCSLYLITSIRYPLIGSAILIFVFIVLYERCAIQIAGTYLSIGDFIWFTYLISFVFTQLFSAQVSLKITPNKNHILALPYILFAISLPTLGWLILGHPIRYMTPSIRQIEWMSFGLFFYVLCIRYGPMKLGRIFMFTLFFSTLIHVVYGAIQLMCTTGLLPSSGLILDTMHSQLTGESKFYYPRITGFLTNPNAIGVYGAMIFSYSLGLNARSPVIPRGLWLFFIGSGVFFMLGSASRSAFVSIISSIVFIAILSGVFRGQFVIRILKFLFAIIVGTIITYAIASQFLAFSLISRFESMFFVLKSGVGADGSFSARIGRWTEVWNNYLDQPYGTWCPPAYVFDGAIDSYYINTAIQGSPLYTIFFLFFLMSLVWFFRKLGRMAIDPITSGWAIYGIGLVGVIVGGSLGLSPLQESNVNAIVWSTIGLGSAMFMFTKNQLKGYRR